MQQNLSSYKQEIFSILYAAGIQSGQVFKKTKFLFFICNFGMLYWFSQLVFDEFNGVFIDSGQDLQYKKLNTFLECQKFLILWSTITKAQAKSFLHVVS